MYLISSCIEPKVPGEHYLINVPRYYRSSSKEPKVLEHIKAFINLFLTGLLSNTICIQTCTERHKGTQGQNPFRVNFLSTKNKDINGHLCIEKPAVVLHIGINTVGLVIEGPPLLILLK
jgi:hypothetical protein